MGLKMTTPKLRDGAEKLLAKWAVDYAKNDVTSYETENEQAFLDGGLRVLSNLHRLLEPTHEIGMLYSGKMTLADNFVELGTFTKPIAIVEVEE